MTTKTQSVAAEVEAIRESAMLTDNSGRFMVLDQALEKLDGETQFEAIELWARLAADLAGLLRRNGAKSDY